MIVNGRYRVARELGHGSYAKVYLASDKERPGAHVALKILDLPADTAAPRTADTRDDDARTASRDIKKEFRLLTRLRHPNLEEVYDFGVDRDTGHLFFTAEFIEGSDFVTAIRTATPDEFVRFVVQILEALEFIHGRDVVHGDLKPENVLVCAATDDGSVARQVKLLDFGLAGARRRLASGDGGARGTLGYAAPEAVMGREVDARSDLYALGILLFQSITGALPATKAALGSREHWSEIEMIVREKSTQFPEPFATMLPRLVAEDPNARWTSAREVLDLLRRAQVGSVRDPASSRIPAEVPFVGRREELAILRRLHDDVAERKHGPRVAVVVGEPGCGKGRLLDELKYHGQLREGDVVSVNAAGAGDSALALIRQIVRRLSESLDPSDLAAHASLFASLGLRDGEGRVLTRPVLGAMFVRFLLALADQRPRTIVVKNVGVADAASRDLLAHAAWRLSVEGEAGRAPLLLVFSLDPAIATPGFEADLRAEGKAVEIRLSGFDVTESRAFLQSFLGGGSATSDRAAFERFADELHGESKGNPLFLRDLLRFVADSGRLAWDAGNWRIQRTKGRGPALPRAVSALLEARYRSLDAPMASVLEALSVARRPIHASLIATSVGILEPEARALVEKLVALGVASRDPKSDLFSTGHPLMQAVVERSLAEEKRQALHARLGEAMLATLGDPNGPGAGDVARHLLASATPRLGIKIALLAADEALERGDPGAAADLFARVAEIVESPDARPPRGKGVNGTPPVSEIHVRHGTAALRAGRFEEAESAVRAAMQGERDPARQAALTRSLGEARQRRGDFDGALAAYEEALAMARKSDDPATEALAQNAVGYLHSLCGRYEQALRAAQSGLDRLRSARTRERALLLNLKAVCELRLGRHEAAIESARASLSLFEELSDESGQASALNNLGIIYDRRGETPLSLEAYRNAARLYEKAGNVSDHATTFNNMGTVLLLQGALGPARELFEKSLAMREELGDRYGVATSIANLGTVARDAGRFADALDRYERSLALFERVGSPREETIVRNHRADLFLQLGDADAARSEIARASSIAKAHKLATETARSTLFSARLVLLEHAATGDPACLAKAREALSAADSMLREIGDARLRCEVLLDVADVDFERGDASSARESANEAKRIADSLRHVDLSARAAMACAHASDDSDARLRLLVFAGERAVESSRPIVCARASSALAAEYGRRGDAKSGGEWLVRAEKAMAQLRLGVPAARRAAFDRSPVVAAIDFAMRAAREVPAPATTTAAGADMERAGRASMIALLEINKRLNTEGDFDRLLEFIIDSAIRLTNAERGFLVLTGDDGLSFRVARNFNMRDIDRPEFAVSRSILNEVIGSGRPMITSDAQADARLRAFTSVSDLKLSSILCTPFKAKDRVLGAIYVDNRFERGLFGEVDLELLKAFADQAAIAIQNLRRTAEIEALNQRLAERVQIQATEIEGARKERERESEGFRRRFAEIIGQSRKMQDVYRLIDKLAPSDIPVLILGESGTGKELVAKAIHAASVRKDKIFLSENCSSIPTTLLESELFGYARGAFTGAVGDKKGLFELAHGGTIFLDEIGDMPPEMQMKLLRVLQEREFRPLGAKDVRHVDVRLVSATNRDLPRAVGEGSFRSDLYYRINGATIVLPPLRERAEDIPLLLDHFLAKFSRESGVHHELSPDARKVLLSWRWPGNVRELENEVRRAVALGDRVIDVNLLSPDIREARVALVDPATCASPPIKSLEEMEKQAIAVALQQCSGNKPEAARRLGISLASIYVKIKRYGIQTK
ncbi:MAG: sigma 54-interacting transcriptional regulator [Planctomycetes bacterium]|nr:sigma 54-interacting transcriptional regulator [Planctomycetota bacterium]